MDIYDCRTRLEVCEAHPSLVVAAARFRISRLLDSPEAATETAGEMMPAIGYYHALMAVEAQSSLRNRKASAVSFDYTHEKQAAETDTMHL